MPVLEAPAEYSESSPEHSLQPEVPLLLAPLLPGPAALAQLRPPTAEARLQQQQQQQLQVERQNRRQLERRNSFDRDEPIVEETEHFPAFVHLLPVVLPPQLPEPTLDELLVSVLNGIARYPRFQSFHLSSVASHNAQIWSRWKRSACVSFPIR